MKPGRGKVAFCPAAEALGAVDAVLPNPGRRVPCVDGTGGLVKPGRAVADELVSPADIPEIFAVVVDFAKPGLLASPGEFGALDAASN